VGAVWSVEHPGTLGNYLAIGPAAHDLSTVWATVERNPVGPDTLGAEEVAEFIDSLDAGGPPSAVRWLGDYLEGTRAIYAIRIYPEAISETPDALDAVFAIRTAVRDAVGGIGQCDGQGFTNEDDRLIWCDPATNPQGQTQAALLDEARAGENVGLLLRGIKREDVERGQVVVKPGSITPHTEFEGQVYILSKDEGGRHTPFFNNYRPQFYFRTTDVTGVVTLPSGTEMVMPGDNTTMSVSLIQPIAMEEGLQFAIREGGRTVGAGQVIKINK